MMRLEYCIWSIAVARIEAVIDPVSLCHLERSRSVCDDVVERSMYLHFKTLLLPKIEAIGDGIARLHQLRKDPKRLRLQSAISET
jgi:hypothetical protein